MLRKDCYEQSRQLLCYELYGEQYNCEALGQDDPVCGKRTYECLRVFTIMEITRPYHLNFNNTGDVLKQYLFATNNGEFHCTKCHKTVKVVDVRNKKVCQKGRYYAAEDFHQGSCMFLNKKLGIRQPFPVINSHPKQEK